MIWLQQIIYRVNTVCIRIITSVIRKYARIYYEHENYHEVDFTVAEDVDGGCHPLHSLVLSPQHCVGRLKTKNIAEG